MQAFLREISPHLDRCGLTYVPRKAIKLERARKQHEAYAAVLREFGVRIEFLKPLPDQPGGVFVEDTAVLLPEVAVIARPGTASRAKEVETIAAHLAQYRPGQKIGAGQLDGGDVLRIGSTIFIAQTRRTNAVGISAFTEIVDPYGYEVRTVETHDSLHLKRAATFIPPDFLVVNPAWIDVRALGDYQLIKVHPSEPLAANTLTLLGTTLVSAACPETERKLQAAGIATRAVDISELQKVEAGLTSLSLILESRARKPSMARAAIALVRTPAAPAVAGHAAQAITHGGLVYVSGQLPINPATGRVAGNTIEAQAEQVLNNIAAILAASGSSLARVLRMTLYLTDRKLLDRVDAVLMRVMTGHRPARSVRATNLHPSGCLLEIEVTAAIADEH